MKEHLQHTTKFGPTCQTGRTGGGLLGEHMTSKFEDFIKLPVEVQCAKCKSSKLFTFLQKQQSTKEFEIDLGDWEPVPTEEAIFAELQSIRTMKKSTTLTRLFGY